MKNFNTTLILFLLLFGTSLMAQNKMLSMEDAILKGRSTLGPKTLRQIKWMNDENNFSFTDVRDSKEALYSIEAARMGKQ
jgi:hypothetical protein